MRIVHIDDSREDLLLVASILRELNDTAEVIQFQDAGIALSSIISGQIEIPDLMLVDLNMPGMNGFDFLKELGDSPFSNDIPTIVLSSTGSQKEIELVLNHGASHFIQKEFDLDEYSTALKKGIDKVLA